MKKTISVLILLVFTVSISYGQEIPKLKLTPNGVEPIIVTVEGISTADIYKKSLEWVQNTYKNPDEVLKVNMENKKIRFTGYDPTAWYFMSLGAKKNMSINYSVEISFKDGRYKFEYRIDKLSHNNAYKGPFKYDTMYKKSGELKKSYIESVPAIEKTMNDLSALYYNYVTGKTNNDDW